METECGEKKHQYRLPLSVEKRAERLKFAIWLRWSGSIRPGVEVKLYADPAWDLLLELYIAQHQDTQTGLPELASRTDLPLSTATRWIRVLETRGWVHMPHDLERLVILTAYGHEALDGYLTKSLAGLRNFLATGESGN